MKTEVIRARVEPELKKEVEGVLHDLGLTTSQAIILFLNKIKTTHSIPFELSVPNEETRKAIQDVVEGNNLTSFKNAEEMFTDLGI